MPLIQLENLTKHYGSTRAVDGLTFAVRPGVVTGFLGPNGSGKSTTMRMIMGLDRPSSGSVLINGRTHADMHWPLREVGALLEARAIHPGRSAYNHLLSLAASNAIPKRRVRDVLDLVGLDSVATKRASRFSLGMGQRLGIATALLGDPGVLLFDEPVNGLDPEGILWVRNLLKDLAREGRTVLVSSHLMSEMALTATDLIVIGKGELIAASTVDDFIAANTTETYRILSDDQPHLSNLLREAGAVVIDSENGYLEVSEITSRELGTLAFRGGVTVFELAPSRQSLEDVFMDLTRGAVEYRGSTTTGGRS